MLDSHPRLAVPDESHFLISLTDRFGRPRRAPRPELLGLITAHPRLAAWDVDLEFILECVDRLEPAGAGELSRAVFAAYAASHGKARWGDKTPGYVEYWPRLLALLPDLQLIHVIRDGREVAASLAEREWGPGSAPSGAYWWRRMVSNGRRAAERLGADRYLEVRYEELVSRPSEELVKVCHFLGEDYDDSMLMYATSAAAQRAATDPQHANLALPPLTGVRDWRLGLSPMQQSAVRAVTGPLMQRLGYRAEPGSAMGRLVGRAFRIRDLTLHLPREIPNRLRTRGREV